MLVGLRVKSLDVGLLRDSVFRISCLGMKFGRGSGGSSRA